MDHLVRIGVKVLVVDDDEAEHCDAYYGLAEEYRIVGGVIEGRYVEDIPSTQQLKFDMRQDIFTRGPVDYGTITREQYRESRDKLP